MVVLSFGAGASSATTTESSATLALWAVNLFVAFLIADEAAALRYLPFSLSISGTATAASIPTLARKMTLTIAIVADLRSSHAATSRASPGLSLTRSSTLLAGALHHKPFIAVRQRPSIHVIDGVLSVTPIPKVLQHTAKNTISDQNSER